MYKGKKNVVSNKAKHAKIQYERARKCFFCFHAMLFD